MGSKKDELRQIEAEMQEYWEKNHTFETDAPEDGQAKAEETYFVTFPFPYMNGRLHLGHAFTVTKADFAIGFQRLLGKKTLFPFGFHCTGMPIKACADKLAREISQYGNPPIFPSEAKKTGSAHAKIQAKTGNITRQWNIMLSLGIPAEEVANFADADYWLQYFPPKTIDDLKTLGTKVDWRRSFVTTPVNPFFDSFVRWQMNHLKAKEKIKFGKRLTIYSPRDGQPCMDHDRSSGEGVGPQEYTNIKIKVLEPLPECLKSCEGKNVFLLAGTLRPETMYGQTNCWIHPDIKYIAFKANDTDIYCSTERAARNMAYQELLVEYGKVEKVAEFVGKELFGCALKAPLSVYEKVYALPMMTIKEGKGTGIVTSVPSDAPADWAALRDVQNKKALREKYGISDDMVLPFKPVPIIDIPEYGDLAALKACDEFKITSQNDHDRLEKAKEHVYKLGFYDGKMIIGECKGKPVQEAKPIVQASLIRDGLAFKYNEPEKKVMSRSGEECVVALCDQWFLAYGEPEWRKQAEEHLKTMTCHPKTRLDFEKTLEWLHEHACSRTYGLGSRLPWDESWLIESLSDSTIYMAYYTVCHFLQGASLDGSAKSPLGITPDQITDAVWDYIFLGTAYPKGCKIPEASLKKLRNEFLYFYPLDLRVSGKDLLQNHLTYSIYNHCAMFPPEHRPRSFRVNAHLQINAEKMSKSTGNFLTLADSIEQYGADATRLTLADSGDSLEEDANFEVSNANKNVLKLHNQLTWIQTEVLPELASFREGPLSSWVDRAFLNDINVAIAETKAAYEKMEFREAIKAGFHQLQRARDTYRDICKKSGCGMHRDLTMHFITVQCILLAPICPHFCEHIWRQLVKDRTDSVTTATYPTAGPVDYSLSRSSKYFDSLMSELRARLTAAATKKGKGKKGAAAAPPAKPTKLTIFVSREFPAWQRITLEYLAKVYDPKTNSFPDNKEILEALKGEEEIKSHTKMLMKVVAFMVKETQTNGPEILETTLPFDEYAILQDNVKYIAADLELDVSVQLCSESDDEAANASTPGKPATVFA